MELIYHPVFLEHQPGSHHPESPGRLACFADLPAAEIPDGEPYLPLVHKPAYIERIKDICQSGGHLDMDIQVSKNSFKAAAAAVGATILASQKNGFALVRPPGHHAYTARASGFCIFNNMAVACKHLNNLGKRVFVLDFDGHYGDGTANIFYESNQVLFLSLHQSPGYPHGGHIEEVGSGEGSGYTIHMPLPPGSGDDVYLMALERLLPVAVEYRPDLVGISAGFDGHYSDAMLNMRLSLGVYHQIGQWLSRYFADCFAVLEGGYQAKVLYQGVMNFTAGIRQEEIPYPEPPTASPEKIRDIFEDQFSLIRRILKPYWHSI